MIDSALHDERLLAVLAALRDSGARRILDLGCGEGNLLTLLMREPRFERIVGIDLSLPCLERLRAKLRDADAATRARVELVHGCITEPRPALRHFDAAVLVETIEHIAPNRLSVLERAVFRDLRPAVVVITTPNADFNALLGVPGHRFRHPDHRFEWGRAKFGAWAEGVARRNGYGVGCRDLAGRHPVCGGASQMAYFTYSASVTNFSTVPSQMMPPRSPGVTEP
jgi:3' terminal RNA ribose 2'-O-methyltransferase Hen1